MHHDEKYFLHPSFSIPIKANNTALDISQCRSTCQFIWCVNLEGYCLNHSLLSNYGQLRLHQHSYLNLHEPSVRLWPKARVISLLWLEAPRRSGLCCLSWYNTTAPINKQRLSGLLLYRAEPVHKSCISNPTPRKPSWEQQPNYPPKIRGIFSASQ